MTKNKNLAFTLAEVLITLGVIGVVAAMTMPTLIKNYQKNIMLNKLKHTYSLLAQAIRMSEVNNGPASEWSASQTTSSRFADTYILPYIKTQKTESSECIETAYPCYKLKDNINMNIWERDGYVDFRVDLNGVKSPNVFGKDQFIIILGTTTSTTSFFKNQKRGTLYFRGAGYSSEELKNYCLKSNRIYCGAWIMENGWKIPDDYPW